MGKLDETQNSDWKKKITFNLNDPITPHDRILLVGDTMFYVQSQCLSLWSEFFATLFNCNFKESEMNVIPIDGVKPNDFNQLLLAIYPTRQKVTVNNLGSMINMSFRFLAPGVLDMCRELIDAEFDKLCKVSLLEVSFRCEFDNLKERSALFIKSQLEIEGTLSTCVQCKKNSYQLAKNPNNYNQDYCSNCKQYRTSQTSQVVKFICIDSSEYFKTNKSHIESLPAECRAYLFNVIFGIC